MQGITRFRFFLRCVSLILISAVTTVVCLLGHARTWKDSTGKFSIEAEFVSLTDDTVELRKADGKSIKVPLNKLSEADKKFALDQSKKTTVATKNAILLSHDGGSIEIPKGSTVQFSVRFGAGSLPDAMIQKGVRAFALELKGENRFVIVTGANNFVGGPLPFTVNDLGTAIERVWVYDPTKATEVGMGEAPLKPAEKPAAVKDLSDSLFAFRVKKTPRIAPLSLAESDPEPGDSGFVLDFPEAGGLKSDEIKQSLKLFPVTMRLSEPNRHTYVGSEGAEYPKGSGSPILNEAGEVLGMYIGNLKDAKEGEVALAIPASTIRRVLADAMKSEKSQQ